MRYKGTDCGVDYLTYMHGRPTRTIFVAGYIQCSLQAVPVIFGSTVFIKVSTFKASTALEI